MVVWWVVGGGGGDVMKVNRWGEKGLGKQGGGWARGEEEEFVAAMLQWGVRTGS